MGWLSNYLEKRRQRRLDEINREIERLKEMDIHTKPAVVTRSKPVSKPQPFSGPASEARVEHERHGGYVKRDVNFKVLFLIVLCVAAIIGVTIYYRMSFGKLNQDYNEKVQEINTLKAELSDLESELNKTASKLEFKEKVEEDLSTQYSSLEEEKSALESEISDLKIQIAEKEKLVENLTTELDDNTDRVRFLEDCITDELNENLTICD